MVDTDTGRIQPGERAIDRDSDDEDEVVVIAWTGKTAENHTITPIHVTVYDANRDYPRDDETAQCAYPASLDDAFGSQWYDWTPAYLAYRAGSEGVQVYAFPESRLAPTGDGDE